MLAVFFSILLANHNLWRFFCLPGLSYFVNFYRGLDQIVQLLIAQAMGKTWVSPVQISVQDLLHS